MLYGINHLAVKGFKSVAERRKIAIAPLTILAGANSSGKSSIIQPLLLLKQTLDATFDPGLLNIAGDNVKFTSVNEFLSRGQDVEELALDIGVTGNASLGLTFQKTTPASALDIVEQRWTVDRKTSKLRSDSSPITRDRFWLRPAGAGEDLRSNVEAHLEARMPPISVLHKLIRDVIHVPGLRGTRERLYPIANTGPVFPGTFDYYHASLILSWQKDPGSADNQLNQDLRALGIGRRVFAHRSNDAAIELRLGLSEEYPELLHSLPDVGFGVSQVLPVLVALRVAEPGRLVYLEEPEIHLHPRAQTRLATILADAAERGVRVVAETHSSLLLRAIQTLVANGTLDPELVQLHWFTKNAQGVTQVSAQSRTRTALSAIGPRTSETSLSNRNRNISMQSRIASPINGGAFPAVGD
jgi:predicted ATPase